MKNRKKKRRKNAGYSPLPALLLIALVIPVSLAWMSQNGALLRTAGEHTALLAAALDMPKEGLDLLRERFREELYLPGQGDEASSAPSPSTPDIPQWPASPGRLKSSASEEAPAPDKSSATAPKIPPAYRGQILSENFATGGSTALVAFEAGFIKNDTRHTDQEVAAILETPFDLGFTNTGEPQVLIVHTHATEAFERYDSEYYDTRNTWRSQDNNLNMVSVGAAMAEVLEENGIGVIHDTTQHDYPSYNGSYERSAVTIRKYLAEYPSIKVVLDLHRDAMERENDIIVKPVAVIDGKKAAQIMIIAACDDDGSLGVPEYRKNLRFAAAFQSYMASDYRDLTRPVFFSYRKYNMDLSPGSLLLEFGSNANTLEEAVYAAQLSGQALASLIKDHMKA